MSFIQVTKEEFNTHAQQVSERSFMQTEEMAKLLEKRGFSISYVAWKEGNQLEVSAIVYIMPMTGGLRMEVNCGPIHSNAAHLSDFYQGLKDYAKANGALELLIKPYDAYQTFDSNGEPTSDEQKQLISQLTDLGYSFDGLQTGYPNGEPVWHYVKDLSGLTVENLRKSFSKKGRPLMNKTSSFGIKIRKLDRSELGIFKEITSSTSGRRDYTDKTLDYYQNFYDSFGDDCEFMVASINFKEYLSNLELDKNVIQEKLFPLEEKIAEGVNSAKVNKRVSQLKMQIETLNIRISEANDFIAKYGSNDIVLAGSLFVYTPQEAVYLFSGSYTEFNRFYAPVALQEYVMTQAIKRGITFYNFLGIMGIFDGSDGVLRFKQNFNGYIVRKMGTFRYYPQPLKYKAIQGIKKLLGRS